MKATVSFNPGHDRQGHAVRLLMQDHTDYNPELATVPRIRVHDVPLNQSFIIGDSFLKRAKRLFKRAARRVQFGAAIAALVLANQISAQHGLGPEHLPLIVGAISSAVTTSWKTEIGTATHNHTVTTGDVFKCALFTSSATLGASTTAYATTNEITGTGYTAAGTTIASVTPTSSGTTAIFDWADASWSTATFTANGCLVYNSSKSNKSVFVVAFGSDQSVTAGTFTIVWPTADASNAIIRIA